MSKGEIQKESNAVLNSKQIRESREQKCKNLTEEQKQQLRDFVFGKTKDNPLAEKSE